MSQNTKFELKPMKTSGTSITIPICTCLVLLHMDIDKCLNLVLFTSKLLFKWVELIFGSPNFYIFPSFLDEDESSSD